MDVTKYASLESQLYDRECLAEDTEEMFWLRQADDYQSMVSLGNALSGQYRFREAVEVYKKASMIKSDDALTYIRIAGAYLSLFLFDESKSYYDKALTHGASKQDIVFYLGIWNNLKGNYHAAVDEFIDCSPATGEMAIAVIYWHTLAAYKGSLECSMLDKYDSSMDVGHHISYKEAVEVFRSGLIDKKYEMDNPLDRAVYQYGIAVYLQHMNRDKEADEYRAKVLSNKEVWPCISYLAAWKDAENSSSSYVK